MYCTADMANDTASNGESSWYLDVPPAVWEKTGARKAQDLNTVSGAVGLLGMMEKISDVSVVSRLLVKLLSADGRML